MQNHEITPKSKDFFKEDWFTDKVKENPLGYEANLLREQSLKEAVKEKGLIPVLQEELCFLSDIAMKLENNENEASFFSVLSMIYTLVQEGRINELYNLLAVAFPTYYTLPDNYKPRIYRTLNQLQEGINNGSIINTLFNSVFS